MSEAYAAAIAKRLIGKTVEIYTSETRETLQFADFSHERPCVVIGKIKEVDGSCIILQSEHPITKKTYDIYLHTWTVNSIMQVQPDISVIDFYYDDGVKKKKR